MQTTDINKVKLSLLQVDNKFTLGTMTKQQVGTLTSYHSNQPTTAPHPH